MLTLLCVAKIQIAHGSGEWRTLIRLTSYTLKKAAGNYSTSKARHPGDDRPRPTCHARTIA